MTDNEFFYSLGICCSCRKEKAMPGKKSCGECLAKFKNYNDKYYPSYYTPERAKEYQEKRREIYVQKKAAGICIRCTKEATHGLYCYECSIKVKRKNIKTSEKRKRERHERGLIPEERRKAGKCLWCEMKALPGLQCCAEHQRKFSDAGKKAYEANLKNKNNPWINEVVGWKKRNGWKDSGNG